MADSKVYPFSLDNELRATTKNPQFSSVSFHYYKVFFNFSYFLLIAPFRFVKNGGHYYLRTNKVQKVCFAILLIILAVLSVALLRAAGGLGKIKDKPIILFILAYLVTNSAYTFVTIYVYWRKQSSFSKILSLCQNEKSTSDNLRHTVIIPTLLCILTLLQIAWYIFKTIWGSGKTPWKFLKSQTASYLFVFYIQPNITLVDTPIPDKKMTIPLQIFGAIFTFLEFYWRVIIHFQILFCMISAVAIYIISLEFNAYLHSRIALQDFQRADTLPIESVTVQFRKVEDLIANINDVSGLVFIVLLLEAVPYFSINIINFIDTENFILKLDLFYILGYYFIVLLVASEGYRNLRDFRSWIFRWGQFATSESDRLKLLSLSMEASAAQFGIEGRGFFTVSYEFVGAMTSTFITYAIILVQFSVGQN